MRKLEREIRRALPGASLETTGGNHLRVVLPNGVTVIVSNSPSAQNYLLNAIADARRQSKKGEPRP